MLLKIFREGLGRIIIFIDWLIRPSQMQRSDDQQVLVEQQLKDYTLYQLYACPFCVKTRRALYRLNLPMETRDVPRGSPHRSELEAGGGRFQVPCLHMRDQGKDVWMYESSDIIHYLEQKFGQ